MNPDEILRSLVNVIDPLTRSYGDRMMNKRPENMSDADAAMRDQEIYPTQAPALSIDELSAMIGQQTSEMDPSIIDALMHQARAAAPDLPSTILTGPTKENGYFIPEFTEAELSQPAAPTLLSPQEEKAKQLQATHGAAGFKFEVDKQGRMVITNTEATRQAAGINLSTPAQAELMAPANFASAMRAIQQTGDPVQRAQMMGQLVAQANVHKAQIYEQSVLQANQRLGVPQLESLLAQNEAEDRADPRWQEFQTDSPKTAQVRQQLASALGHAEAEANRMLRSNTSIAAMEAQVKAAEAVFARGEARDTRRETYQENREFTQALKLQELMETLGPEKIARVAIMFPDQQGRNAEQVALFTSGIKDKDALAVLEAQPEDLAPMAIIGENSHAARVLAYREAERSGRSEEAIQGDLVTIKRNMNSAPDTLARMALPLFPGPARADLDSMIQQIRVASIGGTKAQQEQALMARYQLTTAIETRKKEDRLYNDVGTWGIVDPELDAAVAASKGSDGSANAVDVYKAFIGNATGPDLSLKSDQFFSLVERAAQARARDLIAPINPTVLRNRIEQEATTMTIWEALNSNLSASGLLPSHKPHPGVFSPIMNLFGGSE